MYLFSDLFRNLVGFSWKPEAGESNCKVLSLLSIVYALIGLLDCQPQGVRQELGDGDPERVQNAGRWVGPWELWKRWK